VDAGQSSFGNSGKPRAAVEVAVPHRRTGRAPEHERVGLVVLDSLQVLAHVSLEHGGKRNCAPSSSGFRRPEGRPAAPLFDELPVNLDDARLHVDVNGTERGQLSPPQTFDVPSRMRARYRGWIAGASGRVNPNWIWLWHN
jgi:hypothetical protein